MSEALEILKSCDAFLEGHFLLSSGRHSSAYCQMAYLQQYPDRCAEVMKSVADKVKEMDVDVIVGPVGIVMANAMLGEITPQMAEAVASSEAKLVLIPMNRCHTVIVGVGNKKQSEYIAEAVDAVKGCNEAGQP